MKRIIDSTLVIHSLMLIFGCKESKVGQGNPTKNSMSIDTDSVISGKVFTKQDIASRLMAIKICWYIWDNSEIKVWNIGMLMSGMKSSSSSFLFHHSMIFPILRLTKKKRLLNLSAVVLPLIMSLENGSSRKECLYKKNFCHTPRESE